MKQLRHIRTFITANPMQFVGILLVISVPVFHNLHNIFFDYLANNSIAYYKNYYYFALTILHSLAPALGFLGCFFLVKGKTKAFILIPFAYELYKAFEKMPSNQSYTIYHEFWVASALFMLPFFLLIGSIVKTNKELEKQSEKGLQNLKKELNLK